MKKGFTIFETLIYITLLSLLLVGVFTSAFSLIESAKNLQEKNIAQSEGNFVIQKLRWAFMNIQSITTPSQTTPNATSATIIHHDGTTIVVRKNGSVIEISESGPTGTFFPLTTQNVKVSDLRFSYIGGAGESPAGISATTTINGVSFSITKYLRK